MRESAEEMAGAKKPIKTKKPPTGRVLRKMIASGKSVVSKASAK
jgi:hypothetical protein